MSKCPIYIGVSSPGALISYVTGVPDARQHQPMTNPCENRFVLGQPGDCTNAARNKEKAVRVTTRRLGKSSSQFNRERDTGKVVIRERRMANMTGDEHLIGLLTFKQVFAIGQVPIRERRVNAHVVFLLVAQLPELPLAQAEAPVFLIVRSSIWNPLGMTLDREEMIS